MLLPAAGSTARVREAAVPMVGVLLRLAKQAIEVVAGRIELGTLDDAIAFTNASPYGNGCAIFTQSGAAARHYTHHVDVGQVEGAIIMALGFFIDFFEIAFIILPLIVPAAAHLGIQGDAMIWFGVMIPSFQVGENTPRDKAKISKAQREIDSVE